MDDSYAALALYAGVAAIILLALTINVGARRGAQRAVEPGHMGDGSLTRAIRAHANFTEYTPMVLAMLAILALNRTAALPIHLLGAPFMFGRVLHAFGMMGQKHPTLGRLVGNMITMLVLLIGGGLCLLRFYEAL